jgi:transposase
VPAKDNRATNSRADARQAWAERLRRFASSGLPVAAFCAADGVSSPSFYSWKRRLAGAAAAGAGPRLLPIRLQPPAAPLELALPQGAVLRIPQGADEDTLRCLLRLLGVGPC